MEVPPQAFAASRGSTGAHAHRFGCEQSPEHSQPCRLRGALSRQLRSMQRFKVFLKRIRPLRRFQRSPDELAVGSRSKSAASSSIAAARAPLCDTT